MISWAALRTVSGQWVDEVALRQAAALSERLPASATSLLASTTLFTCAAAAVIGGTANVAVPSSASRRSGRGPRRADAARRRGIIPA